MSGWDIARFGWLLACTLAASVTDVRERRIPNWLVAVCAAATPIWWLAGIVAWSASLLGGVLVGGLFVLPAVRGQAGMGDAKLAAAIGLGLGWEEAGPLLVGMACGLLAGTVVHIGATPRRVAGWPLAPAMVVGVMTVAALHAI